LYENTRGQVDEAKEGELVEEDPFNFVMEGE
jgi:hypothetical protein